MGIAADGEERPPVYHWSEKGIKGHFLVKFFALQLVCWIEDKLKEEGMEMSWEESVSRVSEVQAVKVRYSDETCAWIRTKVVDEKKLQV